MPKLTLLPEERVLELPVNARFVDVADEHETGVFLGCRKAGCGACLVRVQAEPQHLNPPGDQERELLQLLGATPEQRLACQLTILGDVVLELV